MYIDMRFLFFHTLAIGMRFCLFVYCIHTHTLGGVEWEPPPRGPHWDLRSYIIDYSIYFCVSQKLIHVAGRCKVFPTYNNIK